MYSKPLLQQLILQLFDFNLKFDPNAADLAPGPPPRCIQLSYPV